MRVKKHTYNGKRHFYSLDKTCDWFFIEMNRIFISTSDEACIFGVEWPGIDFLKKHTCTQQRFKKYL